MPFISDPAQNLSFMPTSEGGPGGALQGTQGGGDMKRLMLAKALMNRPQPQAGQPYGAANAVSDMASGAMNGLMMKKFMGA